MYKRFSRICRRLLQVACFWAATQCVVHSREPQSHVESRSDLTYGPVLYEFFQKDYFLSLVENETALASNNPLAASAGGQLLKGGMLLNYGLPDESMVLFASLLNRNSSKEVKSKAWFHLSKLYYQQSNLDGARKALGHIKGEIPSDIHIEYHYLASLIDLSGKHVRSEENLFTTAIFKQDPKYSYFMFNIAVTKLRNGEVAEAVGLLEKVAAYVGEDVELLSLADRASHGLAQLAIQAGDYLSARYYLTSVRTSGLYSNRALLSYAWTAIKLEVFEKAIPALELLDSRSIAIPEVQESKVLLAHLYEQEGSHRKALRANLLAEKALKDGLTMLSKAREILDKRDVPREFIQNLDAVANETNWYQANATIDYSKLTPFLIDLMSSNVFLETLKNLAALYSLESNLSYWWSQTKEHQLILANARRKNVLGKLDAILKRSESINRELLDQKTEVQLRTLAFTRKQRSRFNALIETSESQLAELAEKIQRLSSADKPYIQPSDYIAWVEKNHRLLEKHLQHTREFIVQLEPIMRNLMNAELDKHKDRMEYYWAQSRLAKARLYDTTLLELENAKLVEEENNNENASE